jgi:hypothetical protein
MIAITSLRGKLNFESFDLDMDRIECVDKTTAARTSGIAGNDISCISDRPIEFKLPEA